MATGVSFDNYVNRMWGNMRGAQRILFVGRGCRIDACPAIAKLRWRSIFTTCDDTDFAEAFNLPDRQVRTIYTGENYDAMDRPLDHVNPPVVFINGPANDPTEDNDLALERQRRKNRERLFSRMITLLKKSPLTELVVIGYDPEKEAEINSQTLYDEMYDLPDVCVTFCGVNAQLRENRYLSDLEKHGVARLFEGDLETALERIENAHQSDWDDDAPVSVPDEGAAEFCVYIDGKPVVLNSGLCYDFNKYGRVLTVREMTIPRIPRGIYTEAFYNFLKLSPNTPLWYGYSKRYGFAVTRDFEDALYKKVSESLISGDTERPIELIGQTSTGKSIALAALAFRVFNERKYPVLFVNNPEVTFSAEPQARTAVQGYKDCRGVTSVAGPTSPAACALDNILKEIRDAGGRALVILDWSIYNPQRNDPISRISYQLHNRGHNALFVGSTITQPSKKALVVPISAPTVLSNDELKRFKALMIDKGKVPQNRLEKLMKAYASEPEMLSMLYRIVYELHPQLEQGLRHEIHKALHNAAADIRGLSLTMRNPNPQNVIAAQLEALGFGDSQQSKQTNDAQKAKELIISRLPFFLNALAVASLYRLRMPMTMASDLLQIPAFDNREEIFDIIFQEPRIHCVMDDDPYAQGSYVVGFRNPMDARIYLKSIGQTEHSAMDVVAEIIKTFETGKTSEAGEGQIFTEGVRFLERLIRMVGPNSDDPNVRLDWAKAYGDEPVAVINALAALRKSGVIEPLLIAQEITYIREYYSNPSRVDIDEQVEKLTDAIKIARWTQAYLTKQVGAGDVGLLNSITVESIFAELRLEDICGKTGRYVSSLSDLNFELSPYAQRSQTLRGIIRNQPDNSYPYTALLRCFMSEYRGVTPSAKMLADMSDVLEILDVTEGSVPQVEDNEHYQRCKVEFLALFDAIRDSDRSEAYFQKLLDSGSPVGVHLKAKSILRAAHVDYSQPLKPEAKGACEEALAVLEDSKYEEVVKCHAASQYMRLNLTWLCYNHEPLFGRERQRTRMAKEQWERLYEIADAFKTNIIDKQQNCPYIVRVIYILTLACVQLEQYDEAVKLWSEVQEQAFYESGRQTVWHTICDPEGNPKRVTGTFNTRNPRIDRTIFVKEVKRYIHYRSLQSINMSDTTGEARDLCIGISFRGFQVYAK